MEAMSIPSAETSADGEFSEKVDELEKCPLMVETFCIRVKEGVIRMWGK